MPYIGNKNSKFSVRPPSPPAKNAFASLQQFVSSYNLTSTATATHQTVPSVTASSDPTVAIHNEIDELKDNMIKMRERVESLSNDLNDWVKCKECLQQGMNAAQDQLFVIQSQVTTFSDILKQHEEMMGTFKRQLAETAEAVIKLQLSNSVDGSILSELTSE